MVPPDIKTKYIEIFSEILNLEGHLNCCIGSKVPAIFLNWWILPTGEVASGRVCPAACAASLFISMPEQVAESVLYPFFWCDQSVGNIWDFLGEVLR